MTKEQADAKLALIAPYLLYPVTTEYTTSEGDPPALTFNYTLPGGATGAIGIPLDPSYVNLQGLAANLPVLDANRMAVLILLAS